MEKSRLLEARWMYDRGAVALELIESAKRKAQIMDIPWRLEGSWAISHLFNHICGTL